MKAYVTVPTRRWKIQRRCTSIWRLVLVAGTSEPWSRRRQRRNA